MHLDFAFLVRQIPVAFCFFLSTEKKLLSCRSPGLVGVNADAVYVKGPDTDPLRRLYIAALLASGFKQNGSELTPCPLGTFTDVSNKGVKGCKKCLPGNF